MSGANSPTFDHLLRGFMIGGVILIVAAWLITGEQSVVLGLIPFAILLLIQYGQRSQAPAQGPDDAR